MERNVKVEIERVGKKLKLFSKIRCVAYKLVGGERNKVTYVWRRNEGRDLKKTRKLDTEYKLGHFQRIQKINNGE